MRWYIFSALALISVVCGQEIPETCLSVDPEPYLLFGTKTAYTFSNRGVPVVRSHEVPGCQPTAIWLLNRHGSHNPEADELSELQKLIDFKNNVISNYRNGNFRNTNQRMCAADVNLLEQWSWNSRQNATYAGDLTTDGYMSTQQLAQAWRSKYPGLFTDNRYDYLFKYVNDQRSSTTFRAFTEGLFRDQAEGMDVPKETDEKLLRPYKFCPAWTRDVEENNETLAQLRTFESKQEYKEMITNISLRLGFTYDISLATVLSMYEMCRYNKAWEIEKISPWCSVFTKEDIKRLEFSEDLETYYKYGYGTPMNQKIGCTAVKDMMDFFKIHLDHETPQQPKATVHFTEAEMILLTLTALGGYRDSAPLTGDNYHTQTARERRWSSSNMSPFNANLAAVLYKCVPNNNIKIREPYQVLFLSNERTLYLDGCNVGLCDWSLVKNRLGLVADNCELSFCNGANKVNFMGMGVVAIFALCRFIF
ncbi:multiple inositol polyphosphate phosphatase 1-like [Pieris napi]|uniref:multiple inositol polyphosphate phosphatase 1-like n=1 Tax=Pieris napi TaxID=78633 RepID=UPI001FB9708C|nr:multiple inositol polyphosphate phosphatase 1-like [Pieris napi]XP_047505221.1 multiple inositol polyphosphate phosphatase 1-like [Pieris napi]XP_047505222.1 multiple inositol polyphosphate phosphatase 1-like [Pieris napi]